MGMLERDRGVMLTVVEDKKESAPSVLPKYLESYTTEFEYRFTRRMRSETMHSQLLSRFPEMKS